MDNHMFLHLHQYHHDVDARRYAIKFVAYTALAVAAFISSFIMSQHKAMAQAYVSHTEGVSMDVQVLSEELLKRRVNSLGNMSVESQRDTDDVWAMLRILVPAENERCHRLISRWHEAKTAALMAGVRSRHRGLNDVTRVCVHEINRTTSEAPHVLISPMPERAGLVPDVVFPRARVVNRQTMSDYEVDMAPTGHTVRFLRSIETPFGRTDDYRYRPTSRSIYRDYVNDRSYWRRLHRW